MTKGCVFWWFPGQSEALGSQRDEAKKVLESWKCNKLKIHTKTKRRNQASEWDTSLHNPIVTDSASHWTHAKHFDNHENQSTVSKWQRSHYEVFYSHEWLVQCLFRSDRTQPCLNSIIKRIQQHEKTIKFHVLNKVIGFCIPKWRTPRSRAAFTMSRHRWPWRRYVPTWRIIVSDLNFKKTSLHVVQRIVKNVRPNMGIIFPWWSLIPEERLKRLETWSSKTKNWRISLIYRYFNSIQNRRAFLKINLQ
jgi:hypothetical protein